MRNTTKLVLLSTLSAFALLTASTASQALISPVNNMGLLAARKGWDVNPVSAQNANYCAMVGAYDRNVTLGFARNIDGFGSLALNVPGNMFESGKTYDITLQVDGMEARQYTVRALNRQSLIVQIGQDEDFYTALSSNGTLNVEVASLKVSFVLDNFSSGYLSLVNCADTLQTQSHDNDGPRTAAMPVPSVEKTPLAGADQKTEPKKVAAASNAPTSLTPAETAAPAPGATTPGNAAPTPPRVATAATTSHVDANGTTIIAGGSPDVYAQRATEQKNLQQQVDIVRKFADDTRALESENKDLKDKLGKNALEQDDLRAKLAVMKLEKEELASRLSLIEKQSKALQDEMATKDRDLSAVRGLSVDSSKALMAVRKDYDNLKAAQSSTIKELQDRLAEKTEQYAALQSQYTDIQGMQKSALAEADRSKMELNMTRQSLAETQRQLASSERQSKSFYDVAREELSKARGQISVLQSQLSSLSLQKDEMASKLDDQTRQVNNLRETIAEKDQQIISLSTMALQTAIPGANAANIAPPVPSVSNIHKESVKQLAPLASMPAPSVASAKQKLDPVGGDALLPPALQPILKPDNRNISGSKASPLPAINPEVTAGQGATTPMLKLKASVTDVQSTRVPTDESWDTVIVQ